MTLAVLVSLVAVSAVPAGNQGNTIYIDDSGSGLIPDGPTNCYIINESGKYLLNESLTHGLKIIANDVTLDGNGYNLTNSIAFGVQVYNCSDVTVRDMDIFGCKWAGIALGEASDCMVEKNCVTGCTWGINVWGGSVDNKIINNDVYNSTKVGINLAEADPKEEEGSEGNKVHANTVLYNTEDISADEELNDVSGNHVTPEEE
ncbi:right-handed parallel beta-helix repeat-containing protein [Methanococcus maripaludis]|uniref:right-handed parallel beta-helix repeat-containing protein n=1 Tax=Methanococcus maripaludis TaxID=39152 RepID=UPI0021A4A205|nr:right-handed parallel beta-helix repeat-containing protein [Methanococcus maripaludis]